ncbi:MAG: MmgE/PrpD family protein [Clostridia bacterium]|nr:MmgE/PrpD family protein [Clostridia bacterium]
MTPLPDGEKIIEALAQNVLATSLDDLDEDTVEWAKTRILDVIGCVVVGARAGGNAELVSILKKWGGAPEASVLVYGYKLPAPSAALANCVMARSFDYGPVEPRAGSQGLPGHLSETTIPTALAVGELVEANGGEILAALIAGEDVACRVLAAGGFDFGDGWDSVGTVNAIGATAIAGRLLGLSPEQLRNAFGIVLNQLSGSFQDYWEAGMTFKLLQGLSARNGILSAELARAGWTGPKDPLLGRYGYYRLFVNRRVDAEVLTRDLGRAYYTDSVIKPYPSCRITHGAIDCALAIARQHPIVAGEVEAVRVYVAPQVLEHFAARPFVPKSFLHARAAFSFQYTVASALARGRLKPADFTEEAIRDPQVAWLAGRVKLAGSPGVEGLGAEVEVRLKDGRVFREAVAVPRGDRWASPLSAEEIRNKFLENLSFKGLDIEIGYQILQLCQNFEHLKNPAVLCELLSSRPPLRGS